MIILKMICIKSDASIRSDGMSAYFELDTRLTPIKTRTHLKTLCLNFTGWRHDNSKYSQNKMETIAKLCNPVRLRRLDSAITARRPMAKDTLT